MFEWKEPQPRNVCNVETALIIGAVAAAAATAMSAVSASSQASAQSKAADYNAQVLTQEGNAASNSAASNEGASLRRSAGILGEQAAGFGQANIGTGPTVQGVEKQSATMSRLDALNIWYGGELERHQANAAAAGQRYEAAVYSKNAQNDLIMGGIGAGTKLLMGGAGAYGYHTGDLSAGEAFSMLG